MNLPLSSVLAKDDHAFLKAKFSFTSIEAVKKRIKENGLFIAKSKGITAEDKLNETANRILKNFADDIENVSSRVKATLIKDCDPVEYTQSTQMMFFSFIEKQVVLYLINNPDNEGFKQHWKNFRLNFAIRRHLPSEFVDMTINYLDLIRSEMKKMNQKLLKDEIEREDRLWDAFKVILEKNFDLLDIPVAIFAGKSTYSDGAFIDTDAKQLLESNNQLIQMFIQNFPWVFRTCREVLTPFNKMSYSKILIEKIEKFETECLPKFPILFRKEISSSWESNKAIIGVIAEGVQSFCRTDRELKDNQLDNLSENTSELENFQKAKDICDMILNIYLKVPFYNFLQIWAKIYDWHKNLNEDGKSKLKK